ncbi:MAG: ABC transporter ATP-binding protein [Bacteroidota bacterium]
MGFLEVVGVASILPFMELIAEPDAVSKSSWLNAAYHYFGFESERGLLIAIGFAIIVIIAFTNAFGIFTTWMQYKYSWDVAHQIGIRLLRTYIKKPYSYFLNKNSTELQTYLISEIGVLTGGVIIPLIEVVSRMIVAIVIFGLLVYVDPKIAFIMFFGLGGSYTIIYLSRQRFLKKIGQYRIDMNMLRYKTLDELLTGIKTVKVYGVQDFFYKRYENASREFCNVQPKLNLILASPRYVLEFLAFGSILAITVYLYTSSGNIQSALPRLSLYAVAGYRLLPALQRAFASAAKLRHNFPIVEKLFDDLILSLNHEEEEFRAIPPMPFNDRIELRKLMYQYDNSPQVVIDELNVGIEKGQIVAFIGSTGSGKTTLIDLIVGLLYPVGGQIAVDGQRLKINDIPSWQRHIAYVPQEVFLFDDTVARNIVIGKDRENIDMERLVEVTKMADIYKFISEELPAGFDAEIGERGVRLSGGQRQRLGLARALYRNPSLLVLDEATSALDSITEKGVIESLKSLPDDLTIIIIAHRLSTVRHADCIYLLENGQIIAQGTYDSLMHSNDVFKTMVKLS